MQRPSFTATAAIVTILSLLGLASKYLARFTPDPPANRMAVESGDFLRQGMLQPVDWRPFSSQAFAEARRLNRVIMLVIGTGGSMYGRQFDQSIFSDLETAELINRMVVPIRVDALDMPRYASAYLPLSRARLPWARGFQILFLDSRGRLIADGTRIGAFRPPGQTEFAVLLADVRELAAAIDRPDSTFLPGSAQAADIERIMDPTTAALPDFWQQDADLVAQGRWADGGMDWVGDVRLHPAALRYMLVRGDIAGLTTALDQLLSSPVVDWLDGGFFSGVSRQPGGSRHFDKIAVQNAEMAQVLAQASAITGNPVYEAVARATFDALLTEFLVDGYIAAIRRGDEYRIYRSRRASITPRSLREALPPAEREWAREHLGLRIESNPSMVIRLSDPAVMVEQAETFATVVGKLRDNQRYRPQYLGRRYVSVHAYVVARLLATARVLGDEELVTRLNWAIERAERFRAGDDLSHVMHRTDVPPPYLGDYLAYSDLALQDFLTHGSVAAYERGLRVLTRAMSLFESDVSGIWYSGLGDVPDPGPEGVRVPEILDGDRESLTASMIRLMNNYGRLLRNENAAQGDPHVALAQSLCQSASASVSRFGRLSAQISAKGSGFFAAAASILDDAHVVVVGPQAIAQANALARRIPSRLVAPAVGLVRPDLQARPPGFYIIDRDQIEGPLTADEVVDRLPNNFRLREAWRPLP